MIRMAPEVISRAQYVIRDAMHVIPRRADAASLLRLEPVRSLRRQPVQQAPHFLHHPPGPHLGE